jgi:hypothetical protein
MVFGGGGRLHGESPGGCVIDTDGTEKDQQGACVLPPEIALIQNKIAFYVRI